MWSHWSSSSVRSAALTPAVVPLIRRPPPASACRRTTSKRRGADTRDRPSTADPSGRVRPRLWTTGGPQIREARPPRHRLPPALASESLRDSRPSGRAGRSPRGVESLRDSAASPGRQVAAESAGFSRVGSRRSAWPTQDRLRSASVSGSTVAPRSREARCSERGAREPCFRFRWLRLEPGRPWVRPGLRGPSTRPGRPSPAAGGGGRSTWRSSERRGGWRACAPPRSGCR